MTCCLRGRRALVEREVIELGDAGRILDAPDVPASSNPFFNAEKLYDAVDAGDVLLLSGQWVLRRAGYVKASGTGWKHSGQWWKDSAAMPLPNRQEIERSHLSEGAAVDAAMLREQHRRLQSTVAEAYNRYDMRTAEQDGVDAVPIIAISHCWVTVDHADPAGTTLQAVARELAGKWTTFARWGFDEVGVFLDWSSLYQNKPVARTPEQEAIFKRALSQMSLWYAHSLTTVILVQGQTLEVPRHERGWPCYEEALARLFKEEPRGFDYMRRPPPDGKGGGGEVVSETAGGGSSPACSGSTPAGSDPASSIGRTMRVGRLWPKVSNVPEDPSSAALSDAAEAKLRGKCVRGPPVSPARFASFISTRRFTNGSDSSVVSSLYRRCLEEGFGVITQLSFPNLRWEDEHVCTLCETLRDIHCPLVTVLKLTLNDFTELSGMEEAIQAGALPALRTLILAACQRLQSLPPSLGRLDKLETLVISDCPSLRALPASIVTLPRLKLVDLRGSSGHTTVPRERVLRARNVEILRGYSHTF